MKKFCLLLTLATLLFSWHSKAQLSAGDIAFIGLNTDATEGYSFIALTDIPGSDVIFFSDRGIINSGAYILGTEGTYKFTAPAGGISCGTIVSFNETSPDVYTITGVTGATMTLEAGSANLGSGDQVYAYQTPGDVISTVPSDATFIAGIMCDYDALCVDAATKWTQSACVSSTSESIVPPGLTNTLNCVSITPAGPEMDNMRYTGTLTGTSTALRALINDFSNWETNNSPAYTITPAGYAAPSVTCVAPCTDPTVPTVTFSPATVCTGSTATLSISGTLNDATAWHIYTGSCGGTSLGSTAGTTFDVTPAGPSTTYFVRGEGGCVTPGSCGSVTITVTSLDDASFSYGAAAYCVDDSDPTPTITGLAGGTFSAGAGLSINTSTGAIDVSASTPGTYTVTYTTAGTCPNSSSVSVTINALDDASFSYGAAAYCVDDSDPTPTITGLAGGTFSAGAGLSINTSTGAIDVSASTPGTYTVTYTTTGTCPNSSSVSVTINALDDPSFSYGAAAYCVSDSDPTPTITGLAGGTFSAGAGLSINASTGAIDVSASTPGTYTVTYTTTGTCPNSSSVSVTINALDDASFSYGAAAYCVDDSDPTPTITGLAGGTFSAGAGLSINASTGAIDVSASTPGTYTVTYTTTGTCPNNSSVSVTINALDDPSFSYGAAAYCANDSDPTPTITGLAGGTFSAGAGLSINTSTGTIDVSASTPGTYTVTYTTSGSCPNSSSITVTINALDDASFSYGAAAYCVDDSDPTPTITGLAGGTFSSGAGLSINASTGAIDVSVSTPGTYTVTYTTTGTCPNSSSITVTINALDDASFNYGAAAYCVDDSDPTPTITGLAGGTFSAGAGLSINTSTGAIDVSASTPGTYTVTYTTSGSCPNSSSVSVTINALDDASFSYDSPSYCVSESDPSPTITGLAGGTFTAGVGLSIDGSTGEIDVSASTPGTYTVTYTTTGTCPNSSSVSVTINTLDDASFTYGAAAYCVDDSDPTPTITGVPGGAFTAGAGLSINASTGAIDVSASTPGTYTVTYTTVGICGNSSSVSVTINALDDASFSYDAAAYCADDTDPIPTITGLAGGTFSAGAGLSINSSTGVIDVSASTPGSYTVTYTTGGTCPNSSSVTVTINALDDASFSYGAAAYCVDDSDPTPTITGLAGGAFSAGAGLSINASTGVIDVSASTPGTYTVTYTTTGTCPNSSGVTVTINALDDASFSYGAAAYCVDDSDPTPTITGLAGGTFSAGAGLSINTSTGAIDVSASTPGTYTVTYTTSGSCPNSSGITVTINALDDASFSYDAAAYCIDDSDPTPTITGLAGGAFTAGAGLSIDGSTGEIDVSASTPGTYTVTYTTTGTCPNSSSATVTINALDDASFSYGASAYCVNDSDPIPTITGLAGGTFSSGGGLSINTSTGEIDVSASTPGTYTVTYTTTGTCPNSSSVTVIINSLDDASFSYDSPGYCISESDPTPAITGLAGGAFTAGAGLSIDGSTGTIDVSLSTPGTYTVTYTTTGTCPNSSSVTVTINTLDDASFNYDAATYCPNGTDPTPTITGVPGGAFTSSPLGLSLNASTGEIDLSASTEGTYTVTYTTVGTCSNSSTQTVTVIDNTDPIPDVATLPDVTAECEVATLTPPTATDNCGGIVTVTNDAILPITDQGTTVVTWTYDDGNGNTTTQTQNVVIDDVTDPVPDDAILEDVTAECEVASLTFPTATDNCGGVVTVTNDAILPITDQGTTVVTWTYDDGNGNTITQEQNIVIDDITFPDIIDCPEDMTVAANNDTCSAIVFWTEPTVLDNCDGATITSTHSPGDVFPSGTTTVIYTATDVGMNETTCSFEVTVNSGMTIDGIITDEEFGGDGAIDLIVTGDGEDPIFTYDWDTDEAGDFDDPEDLADLIAGTYIVEVMNEFGCTERDTFIVELACLPLTVTVSDFELCQNELLTLDATSESGATITWDGGAIDGVPFTPGVSGLVIYTATSEDLEDCPYSVDINILPTPTVIASAGDGEFCEGEPVVLAAGGDADEYEWDPLDFTPPVGITIYTLVGIYLETGCTDTSAVDVIVHALPTVIANADNEVICIGSEVTLTGTGAIEYIWDPETITDGVPFNPGPVGLYNYSVEGTDENGCSNADNIEIEVVDEIAITYVTTDETLGGDGAINITVTGGLPPYSFDWDNDGTGDFDDPEDLTDLTAGTYVVNVEGSAGCATTATVIVDSQLGIIEAASLSVVIYPNPTHQSHFFIQSEAQFERVWMVDMSGKYVEVVFDPNEKRIDFTDIDPGNYILILKTTNDEILRQSVIILE